MTVSHITVSMDLDDLHLGAKIIEPTTSFSIPTDLFNVVIAVPTQAGAAVLKELLPQQKLSYTTSFQAQSARQNNISIKYKDLAKSALFAALNGMGTSEAYIQRDDLRRLSMNIHSQIEFNGIIEAPEQFDNTVFERILGIMTTRTNAAETNFDRQKWLSTYNGLDLQPTEIAKALKKEFTWDEGSKAFNFATSIDTGGKVGLFDILSAEGKAAGSYNQDDLQTWLKKHGVEASFEGHEIIPKSIELKRINMNQFSSDAVFSSVLTVVANEIKNDAGSIDFSLALDSHSGGTALPGRVANLEDHLKQIDRYVIPVGGIISFRGTDGCAALGKGWTDTGIGGKFIRAAGDQLVSGSTGGAANYQLTGANMPLLSLDWDHKSNGGDQGFASPRGLTYGKQHSLDRPEDGRQLTIPAGSANPLPINTVPPYVVYYSCARVE